MAVYSKDRCPEEYRVLMDMTCCDYKNCYNDNEVFVGEFVDYSNGGKLVPVFMCEKHANKMFKIANIGSK